MFSDNKEFDNMFTEEKSFEVKDMWNGSSLISLKEDSLHKFMSFEDDHSIGYESTGMCLTREKALSSYCEDISPVIQKEEVSVNVMESKEMNTIKNMIVNNTTDMNCFLDSHVFFDLECEQEIIPLGEVTLSTNKRKIRKSPAQIKILKVSYDNNDEWNRDLIDNLAAQAGLSFKQVYKWYASERKANSKRLPKGCSKKTSF
mmetsp:Transcript_11639/g.13171  ORF Transcript_11639/g.13171 Transcript_11639/m.13171 type:complete len:202 (-) Transcript_11639:76-681(-)